MDIDKYINENLDQIIEDSINKPIPTLEEELDDVEDLMFENAELANEIVALRSEADLSKHEHEYREFFAPEIEKETGDDIDIEHLFKLLNIFTKYYNEKFDKNENYFTGIHEQNESSQMMELFLEASFEYRGIMEYFDITDNETMMKMYYSEKQTTIIEDIMEKSTAKLYQCDIRGKNAHKIYSMSVLVCLNYILVNGYENVEWYVFTLSAQ